MNNQKAQEQVVKKTVSSQQMREFAYILAKEKVSKHNPKMLSEGKTMRKLGTLPVDTLRFLERIDPELFREKKKAIAFFKKYKVFASSDYGSNKIITI